MSSLSLPSDIEIAHDHEIYPISSTFGLHSEDFKNATDTLIADRNRSTQCLVTQAHTLISSLKNASQNLPKWMQLVGGAGLHLVLTAMLACAPTYITPNGPDERSRRYVAASICACQAPGLENNDPSCLNELESLATTWFSYLFGVCKAHGSYRTFNSYVPTPPYSAICTPKQAEHTNISSDTRRHNMREFVLKRQDYQCAVTRMVEPGRYPIAQHHMMGELENTRILKHLSSSSRSSGVPEDDSAMTLDIIRNFGALNDEDVQNIVDSIDTPENGLALEANAHKTFDQFQWSLEATETPNHYTVKVHVDWSPFAVPLRSRSVIFQDCSASPQSYQKRTESTIPTDSNTKHHPIALPNPRYIGLHNALAAAMHMSGAADVLDKIFEDHSPEFLPSCGADIVNRLDDIVIRNGILGLNLRA